MDNTQKRHQTLRERQQTYPYSDRQNTLWKEEIAKKCNHEWQPVTMIIGQNSIQPDLNNARTFCVCMKCCAHTWIETGYIGYYLNSPDLMEDNLIESPNDE